MPLTLLPALPPPRFKKLSTPLNLDPFSRQNEASRMDGARLETRKAPFKSFSWNEVPLKVDCRLLYKVSACYMAL